MYLYIYICVCVCVFVCIVIHLFILSRDLIAMIEPFFGLIYQVCNKQLELYQGLFIAEKRGLYPDFGEGHRPGHDVTDALQ